MVAVATLQACPDDDMTDGEGGGAAGSGPSLPQLEMWRLLPSAPLLPACPGEPCERNSDCDDGLWCTGSELCDADDPAADGCGCVNPNRSPCTTDYICDESARACWPPPHTGACTRACDADDDCDDGLYCNGRERCTPGRAGADSCGCQHAVAPPCGIGQTCREDEAYCYVACEFELDGDDDGVMNSACGGSDCDDDDPLRYPGNTEICDHDDRDEDCDASTFGARDADDDGYLDAACCNGDGDGRYCGSDCDDTQGDIHPSEAESCDARDNDCDGATDERVAMTLYTDDDRDGFGTGGSSLGCVGTPGTSPLAGDCDDDDAALHPGAMRCGAAVNAIDVCANDGTWTALSCGMNAQMVAIGCVEQPNGTGHCSQEAAP